SLQSFVTTTNPKEYHDSRNGLRFYFFFQAEDGIRDKLVTGVKTCALPIYPAPLTGEEAGGQSTRDARRSAHITVVPAKAGTHPRSEERRVGKECRSWWSAELEEKKEVLDELPIEAKRETDQSADERSSDR